MLEEELELRVVGVLDTVLRSSEKPEFRLLRSSMAVDLESFLPWRLPPGSLGVIARGGEPRLKDLLAFSLMECKKMSFLSPSELVGELGMVVLRSVTVSDPADCVARVGMVLVWILCMRSMVLGRGLPRLRLLVSHLVSI